MLQLIEYLKEKDLLKNGTPNEKKLSSFSGADLLDTIQEANSLCVFNEHHPRPPFSRYTFSTNISLSGGRSHCSALECRSKMLDQALRFASLFSDKVYLPSYFSRYNDCEVHQYDELASQIHDDLMLLGKLEPFIENGLVGVISGGENLCLECVAQQLGLGNRQDFLSAQNELADSYLENFVYSAYSWEGTVLVGLDEGPNGHGHTGAVYSEEFEQFLRAKPSIWNEIVKGGEIVLSKSNVRKMGVHKYLVSKLISELNYETFIKNHVGANFLTDSINEVQFVNHLHGAPQQKQNNAIAMDRLTSIIPYVENLSLSDLLLIRDNEKESLAQFRQTLDTVINEFQAQGNDITDKSASQLFSDVLEPEVMRLDRKLVVAKNEAKRKLRKSASGLAFYLSFGLTSGALQQFPLAAVAGIGALHKGKEISETISDLIYNEDVIEDEDFYFLWKLRSAGH